MTIGERIKARRLYLNMTQDELAKRVGYKSRSSINKIELSRVLPNRKIVEMADALEITPSELMGWSEEKDVSVRSAHVAARRIRDPRLTDALEKYFELPESEKQNVIDYIDFVYNKSKS